MKKIALVLLAALAFYGCSKDHNKTAAVNPLVGKWYIYTDTITTYVGGVQQSKYYNFYEPGTYYQFDNTGSGLYYTPGNATDTAAVSAKFTYSEAVSQLTFNFAANTGGTVLTATSKVATILSLANHNLGLDFDQSTTTNGVTTRVVEHDYMTEQ